MNSFLNIQKEDVAYLIEEVKENYKQIHQHPERGFEEVETSRLIIEKLKEYGVESRTVMLTGVIADIHGSRPGKTVALRADIDGLPITEKTDLPYASKIPERMHACGHDAHTAMLLGAARYLSEHRDQFAGTVRLIFQPAEEGWAPESLEPAIAAGGSEQGGAVSMIKAGALDGVDMCFGFHVQPWAKTGTLLCRRGPAFASPDTFELTVIGKGGHAAHPQRAIDPIQTAAEIVLAYHSIPAREFGALDNCVVSVCMINADSSASNIIPGSVQISGTVRTFNQEIRETIARRLEEIAEHICAAHRCKADFRYEWGCAPVINSPEAADLMMNVAREILGEGNVKEMQPEMGSEDVGEYFRVVPGAMAFLGVTKEGEEAFYLHNPQFKVDLDALEVGVRLHINNVLRFLQE